MKAIHLSAGSVALGRSKAADYLELTKPRIGVLALFTVAVGAVLAGGLALNLAVLIHTLIGAAMVAGGASALNQLLERHSDARMRRTENRPLPAGRLTPTEALVFGSLLGVGGLIYLALTLREPVAAAVAAITFVSYVAVYTPLKPLTTLNTLMGAVPGALPPVIGWTAVRGDFSGEAVTLFLIIFLWQVPHFLAIAWIYREEYGRAGLQMLPVHDPNGTQTARQMVHYCLALIPASLLPVINGSAGLLYFVGAVLLGLGFLKETLGFHRHVSNGQARRVLYFSLLYLPGLLALLLINLALTHGLRAP